MTEIKAFGRSEHTFIGRTVDDVEAEGLLDPNRKWEVSVLHVGNDTLLGYQLTEEVLCNTQVIEYLKGVLREVLGLEPITYRLFITTSVVQAE